VLLSAAAREQVHFKSPSPPGALRRKLFVAVSIGLFLVSLTQPCYCTTDDVNVADAPRGIFLLLGGWMGVLFGILAWLANPALAASWLLLLFGESRKAALPFALASLGLGLSFLWHDDILVDERGGRATITGYAAGYWFWIASMAVMVAASVIDFWVANRQDDNPSRENDGKRYRTIDT